LIHALITQAIVSAVLQFYKLNFSRLYLFACSLCQL